MLIINDRVCYLNKPIIEIVDFYNNLSGFQKYLQQVGYRNTKGKYWENKTGTILSVIRKADGCIMVSLEEHSTKLLGKQFLWFGYINPSAKNGGGCNNHDFQILKQWRTNAEYDLSKIQ